MANVKFQVTVKINGIMKTVETAFRPTVGRHGNLVLPLDVDNCVVYSAGEWQSYAVNRVLDGTEDQSPTTK